MTVPLVVIVGILLATAFAAEETCGATKSNTDISNGGETAYGEFPWLAALEYTMANAQYSVGIKCGGAVINKRFVLTAAQCLTLKHFEIHSVWLGVRKLSDIASADVDKVKKIGIEKQIPHESYDPFKSSNDIALLKLDSNIVFSEYIRPVCLPDLNSPLTPSGTTLTIAGWGQTGLCGPTTDIKSTVQVPLYSHAECMDNYKVIVRSDQICTAADSLQSTCWGDMGVPIMESRPVGVNRQWFAVGMVTSNEGCTNRLVVAHTRVSSYATWIAQKVQRS